MAGHSRSKNGVASLAYVPAIHAFVLDDAAKTWMPGTSPGMTQERPCRFVVVYNKTGHRDPQPRPEEARSAVSTCPP
jgi:hypothetical protein